MFEKKYPKIYQMCQCEHDNNKFRTLIQNLAKDKPGARPVVLTAYQDTKASGPRQRKRSRSPPRVSDEWPDIFEDFPAPPKRATISPRTAARNAGLVDLEPPVTR